MNYIKALLRSAPFSALLLLVLTLSLTGLNQLPGNADSGYSYARVRVTNTTPISNISVSFNASTANTLAQAHWSAIAEGDLTKVMSQYGESPILHWICGPLAGEYQGKESLQSVWKKFIKAQAPLKTSIVKIKSSSGERGTKTVKALVTFSNAKVKIPVDYTLVEKPVSGNYQITEQTWKIVKL